MKARRPSGVVRVERKVGASGLEDAEETHDQRCAPIDAEAHQRLRSDAAPPERERHVLGPSMELGVREGLALERDGGRVRGAPRLRGEELVEARARRVRRGAARQRQEALCFAGGQDGQGGDALLGIRDDPFEQGTEARQQALDGGGVEEVERKLDPAREPARAVHEGQREVELGGGRVGVDAAALEPAELQRRRGRRLQREHHLEERRAAGIARRIQLLDQPLEGRGLVRVRTERVFPDLLHEVAEREVGVDPGAQHQRVDEEADQAFGLGVGAVGDRRAHHHVGLARPAVEQHVEGREQRHEEGHALASAESAERVRRARVEREGSAAAAVRGSGGSGAIGGQIDRGGGAGEATLPVGELPIEGLAGQPAPLPGCVVGVLDRQGRQGRRATLGEGLVERSDLAVEHADRPAVGDDVVHGDAEDVRVGAEREEVGAYHRATGEIEGARHLGGEGAPEGLGVERGELENEPRLGVNERHRAPVDERERRAEDLVAALDLAEGPSERGDVQRSVEARDEGDDVRRVGGIELVQEPEALLREREGPWSGARQRDQRGRQGRVAGLERGADPRREVGDCRGLEERPQRELDVQGDADAGDHLGREERVPSQLEEAVVRAPRIRPQPEHLGEDGGQRLLDGPARGDALAEGGVVPGRRGQRAAIHLAVAGQRQLVERDDRGRHQVLRQPRPEPGAQLGATGCAHHVGHETAVSRGVLADDDHAGADAGVGGDGRLDLARLDAEAAQLDLLVEPAEERQRAVREPPHPVAGAVEPRAGPFGEGIGYESLRRQLRAAQVSARQPVTAHVQLAGHADGYGRSVVVEHVDTGAGEGTADGDAGRGRGRGDRVAARERGALGGAVSVDERHGGQQGEGLLHVRDAERLAAREEAAQRSKRLGALVDDGVEEPRGEPEGGHALRTDHLFEQGSGGPLRREDHETPPVEQRPPDLQRGRVEADGRELEEDLVRAEAGVARVLHQPDHAAVHDAHALGRAGRAGRVHDVGQALARSSGHRLVVRLLLEARGLGLHVQHRGGAELPARGADARGDHHRGARVGDHPGEARVGKLREERDVGSACLEDGERRDDHLHRALGEEAHRRLQADAP